MADKAKVEPDDPRHVERFRAGDAEAFDQVVSTHRRMIYRVALRLVGNHEDADEVAQMTFVRAWKSRGQFRGEAKLSTWLVQIALNVARSQLSRRPPDRVVGGQEQSAAEGLGAFQDLRDLKDPRDSAEDRLRLDQARQNVRHAVQGLPPRQREVVALKVFSELTHREVAALMQLSEGAVKAHLHQALGNLRRRMGSPTAVGRPGRTPTGGSE